MIKQQQQDPAIKIALEMWNKSKVNNRVIARIKNEEARALVRLRDRMLMKQGVLHRIAIYDGEEVHQLVLPKGLRKEVLHQLHDQMAHQAAERTMELLKARFFWPSMYKDVEKYVKECPRCVHAKGDYSVPNIKQGRLQAKEPLDILYIDFTLVDKSAAGRENVLVMTDGFSKFAQAVVTRNQKAPTVAKALVTEWFYKYGVPQKIHSDQGKSFDCELIRSLCQMYGVEASTTTPYNPRGNSQCERFNRTLHDLLRVLDPKKKGQWPKYVGAQVFAYNATPHATTKRQPYELMFGRKAQLPCDRWLGLYLYDTEKPVSKCRWLNENLEALQSARFHAGCNADRAKEQRDNTDKGVAKPVQLGGVVLVRDHPEGRHKITDKYKEVPFEVVKVHGENVYTVRPLHGRRKERKVNRRQIFDLGKNKVEYEAALKEVAEEVRSRMLPPAKSVSGDSSIDTPALRPRTRLQGGIVKKRIIPGAVQEVQGEVQELSEPCDQRKSSGRGRRRRRVPAIIPNLPKAIPNLFSPNRYQIVEEEGWGMGFDAYRVVTPNSVFANDILPRYWYPMDIRPNRTRRFKMKSEPAIHWENARR
jgi:transposase InsO family protein